MRFICTSKEIVKWWKVSHFETHRSYAYLYKDICNWTKGVKRGKTFDTKIEDFSQKMAQTCEKNVISNLWQCSIQKKTACITNREQKEIKARLKVLELAKLTIHAYGFSMVAQSKVISSVD